MNDRIGVMRYASAADGSRQLVLPSGEIAVVGHDLDDGGVAERFGLDAVRHADAFDWCRGVCRDGPMAGTVVYAVNRIGATVLIALPPRPGNAAMEYEVTRVSTDAGPADLRLSKS